MCKVCFCAAAGTVASAKVVAAASSKVIVLGSIDIPSIAGSRRRRAASRQKWRWQQSRRSGRNVKPDDIGNGWFPSALPGTTLSASNAVLQGGQGHGDGDRRTRIRVQDQPGLQG